MPSRGSAGRSCFQAELLDLDPWVGGYFDPLDAHESGAYPILPRVSQRQIFNRKREVCLHKYRLLPKDFSFRKFMVELVLGIFQKTFLIAEVIVYEGA